MCAVTKVTKAFGHRRMGTFGIGGGRGAAVTFLPEKTTQCPNA